MEKGEISSHWSADAQERMKRRIQEYKEKRRNASPIATSIEAQRSQKRRKGNNKQEPIITLITLPPPKSIDTSMEANRSQKLREGYEQEQIKELTSLLPLKPIATSMVNEYDSQSESEVKMDNVPNHLITDWFLDSGANAHFCNDRSAFIKYKPICEKHNTAKGAGSNQHLPIMGQGTVDITLKSIHGTRTLRVTNVYYSPLIRINVLSLSRFFEISGIWGEWRKTIILYTNDGTPFGAAEYSSNGL